jgi:hypothetical protein
MNELNEKVSRFPVPVRMRSRPVSSKGYPVPWFVEHKDENGEWDFRVVHRKRYVEAHNKSLCWVCGQPLGRFRTFVIGPMCAVNRVTSEPPTHRECAEWSVQVCPFLSAPRMRRNSADLPEGAGVKNAPGIMIDRNPGVSMLWHTERGCYHPMKVSNGFLFKLDEDPVDTAWFREGRPATRAEVMVSVDSGLPKLWEMVDLENDKQLAGKELEKQIAMAREKFFDRIAA